MKNGRINTTLPRDVHKRLRVYCVERELTIAEVIVHALNRLFADESKRVKQ